MALSVYGGDLMPLVSLGYGVRTPFGVFLPPGGKVAAYVRSGGVLDGDDQAIREGHVFTIQAALDKVRAGLGDTIVCLPGHSESTSSATYLSALRAGTRIIGLGRGSNMPTLRLTATAAQLAIAVNDVQVSGLKLRLEGANGVVKAVNITGADCVISDCDIEVASGAALKATIAIEVGAGAHRTRICRNVFRGTATHNVTDGVLVAAAVTDVAICDNEMMFSATAANGLVRVTAAALSLKILRNVMANTHTSSSACVAIGAVAATGIAAYNLFSILADGTANATGITFGAGSLMRAFQNFCGDEANESGVLSPAALST